MARTCNAKFGDGADVALLLRHDNKRRRGRVRHADRVRHHNDLRGSESDQQERGESEPNMVEEHKVRAEETQRYGNKED